MSASTVVDKEKQECPCHRILQAMARFAMREREGLCQLPKRESEEVFTGSFFAADSRCATRLRAASLSMRGPILLWKANRDHVWVTYGSRMDHTWITGSSFFLNQKENSMNTLTQAFLNSSPVGRMMGSPSPTMPGQGSDIGKLLQDLSQLIDGQQSNGQQNGGQQNGAGSSNASNFLSDLAGMLGGQQGAQSPGGSTGAQPGESPLTGAGTGSSLGTQPNTGLGEAGQGMHNVKINSMASGGDALHLQADSQGNLYNGSGNNVGHMGEDGSVTLNSGATKEAAILATGHADGQPDLGQMMGGGGLTKPTMEDGGNKVFNASQVSVSSGDLNQQNDV